MKLPVHSENQVKRGNHVKRGNQRGLSLIEMAFAVAILAIVGGALVSMGLTTVKMTTSAKLKTQATALAQERIEQLKACRDRVNSLEGVYSCSGSSTPSLFSPNTSLDPSGYSPGLAEVTATVVVSWQERGGTKTVTLQTILSDWKAREATGL